jgi:Bacterial SH3 domain
MVFLMQRKISLLVGALTLNLMVTALPAAAVPRRPIVIHDQTSTDPSFAKFAAQLNQAIRDRNATDLTRMLPAQTLPIGFGLPLKINDLQLNNGNSRFWGILEHATKPGCARSQFDAKVWLCAPVAQDFLRQYPAPNRQTGVKYQLDNVIVLGQQVNVRSQPSLNGRVIGQLSNEVVQVNSQVKSIYDPNPLVGWTSVVLPDGKRGYVSNRFAYFALGYTLQIEQVNQRWQITKVLAGD